MRPFVIVVALCATAFAQPQPPQSSPDPVRQKVDAIRQLTQAQQWDQVDAQLASLPVDDPAWERLPSVIYSAGIARKDLPWVLAKLSRVTESPSISTTPAIKAAALIVVARVHRRQQDFAAATASLEEAKAAAPGTKYAEDASGLIYEITYLRPGVPAPAFSAKARNGRTISLAALAGKPAVLVFWGTT